MRRFQHNIPRYMHMVRAPLEHNDYRLHHSIAEPLTSRHESRINHHIMVLVLTAGLALRGGTKSTGRRMTYRTAQHEVACQDMSRPSRGRDCGIEEDERFWWPIVLAKWARS